jgi:Ankyrin repeats (many copies)/MYND finger
MQEFTTDQQEELWDILKGSDVEKLEEYCLKYTKLGRELGLTVPPSEDMWAPIFSIGIGSVDASFLPVLLKYGVHVDSLRPSYTMETALMLACNYGNVEPVRQLVANGANITMTDFRRRTPADINEDYRQKLVRLGEPTDVCDVIAGLLGPATTCALCRVKCDLRCIRCQKVYYCGKEHQTEHWKVHKKTCKKQQL